MYASCILGWIWYAMQRGAHREHHRIAKDLYELLVQEAHVAGAEEAECLRPALLNGDQLLQKLGSTGLWWF
jgi:hypothetical protein